ncbi:hypothetical protein GCM10009839_35130 [Catenulispora yoronensis]|uniref:Zinc-ribbon 15 domain-containing protein n=1 Tax=Catenulispora yoronensis TaxID=450799 RepID=A0ABN2U8B2_9ACTN
MIIWGWRTVFRVVGTGVFSCPSCGTDREYQRRRAQRFFTLFFIPLIPLKTIGEFIRCTHCKTDFRESVLARPTAAQFTDRLQNAVRGVMVNVLRRGGAGNPAARAVAVEEIVTAGAVGYSEANLAQDMQVVPDDLTQLLGGLAGQLPETGREAMVRGAIRVAAADGPVDAAERAVIDMVGAALGMTQAHVAGVVASVPPAGVGGNTGSHTGFQTPSGSYGAVQDAVPPRFDQNATHVDTSSSMETMLIPPKPAAQAQPAQPAPHATLVQDTSSMETMLIPPKPAAAAPAAPAQVAPPAAQAAPAAPAADPDLTIPVPTAETVVIAAPAAPLAAPAPPVAAPVAPVTDAADDVLSDSSAMETMVVPRNQVPPQRPADPAEEPTHVTRDHREPGAWSSNQQ